MSGLELVVVLLATYRITRLITADKITERIRLWAEQRNAWLGYLVTCDWCLSIWLAPIPAGLMVAGGDSRVVWWLLVALAASAAAGLLSLLERRLDQ